MIGSGKKEGWSECFQDLGSWCPPPQDELHTPKVNLQDEFNFSIDEGHANDWDLLSSPVDLQYDPWVHDTQFGISPCQPGIGEINNTLVQERTPQGVISNKTPNLLGSGGKLLYTLSTDGSRSPLKPKGNVLLSQGIVKSASEDSTFLSMAAAVEHKTNNSVVIANNCLVLPIAVPEFDSAKLNSSSLSTSFVTSQMQSPSPTPQPPTKKVSVVREDTAYSALSQPKLQTLFIKEEEQGFEDNFKVPAASNDGGNSDVQPLPVYHRNRPQLKLNIAAANNTSKLTSNLSTPEVLRPLVEEGESKGFNLLQYVCNDDEFPGLSQDMEEEDDNNVGEQAVIRDHDYTDPLWQPVDVKSDVVIKSEPSSPASPSCSVSNSSASKGRRRRKRHRDDDSSDYIASETDETLSEDDSQEWSPTPAKKRTKRKTSFNSTAKSGGKSGTGSKRLAGSRRASTNIANSQPATEKGGGQDKYRALRERNNEASRRSRMNRKQRDVEMLQMSDELYKRNVYLKARAEKMESLVKYMRAEIMKALTKK